MIDDPLNITMSNQPNTNNAAIPQRRGSQYGIPIKFGIVYDQAPCITANDSAIAPQKPPNRYR